MPEDQNQAPAPAAPEPQAAPASAPQPTPAAPQPQAAGKTAKKTNGCLIAVIVVVVILVLAGIGIYLVSRFVWNKVSDTVKTDGNSTSINLGDTKGSVSTSGDSYADTTEQTPTVALISNVNNEVKPILAKVLGGAKTSAWSSLDADSGSITYITKNAVTAGDYAKIKDGLTAIGYISDADYSSSDGSMLSVKKGNIQVVSYLSTSEDSAHDITVTVSQTTADTSE